MTDEPIDLRGGIMKSGKDAFIAELHADAPLRRNTAGFWVANRFDDVRAILLDHERFSSSAIGDPGSTWRISRIRPTPPTWNEPAAAGCC